MRMVFTGGGTGGHILPIIAVIQALREIVMRDKQNLELAWVGQKGGAEEKFARQEGVKFVGIHAGKWRRYFSFENFFDIFRVLAGCVEAFRFLRTWKPDLVFVKGGFVSVPAGIAASLLRIPLILHESDATPGLATRVLARFADKILFGFEPASYFFTNTLREAKRSSGAGGLRAAKPSRRSRDTFYREKVSVVGTPVRRSILEGKKEEGYRLTGFSHHRPIVLILGGSLGAAALNNLVWESLPQLESFCNIMHITGIGKNIKPHQSPCYYVQEYSDETFPHLYAIADCVISRAGASALAELIALRKPHMLFPLGTHASRGDQWANARFLQKRCRSPVFSELTLSPNEFVRAVKEQLLKEQLEKAKDAIPESLSFIFRESAELTAKILLSARS